jgi:hypothetical protein
MKLRNYDKQLKSFVKPKADLDVVSDCPCHWQLVHLPAMMAVQRWQCDIRRRVVGHVCIA